jgi:hypothetical protein
LTVCFCCANALPAKAMAAAQARNEIRMSFSP